MVCRESARLGYIQKKDIRTAQFRSDRDVDICGGQYMYVEVGLEQLTVWIHLEPLVIEESRSATG